MTSLNKIKLFMRSELALQLTRHRLVFLDHFLNAEADVEALPTGALIVGVQIHLRTL